jgi:hypothetical protein
MEQEDIVSKQVFLHYVSYTNMLRKKAASMPGKRKLKQHSRRWVELRKANLVSNYPLHMLPSTKPHQNTKCLPSSHSDIHIMHARNYKTALHISSIFKKEEFTFTIHSLPH